MSDKDDQAETDGAHLNFDEHRNVHHRFVKLWNERTCDDPGEPTLAAAWRSLANLLDNHVTSEERDVTNY